MWQTQGDASVTSRTAPCKLTNASQQCQVLILGTYNITLQWKRVFADVINKGPWDGQITLDYLCGPLLCNHKCSHKRKAEGGLTQKRSCVDTLVLTLWNWCQTSGTQNCKRINFCYFKQPSLWSPVPVVTGNDYTPLLLSPLLVVASWGGWRGCTSEASRQRGGGGDT